MFKLVIFPVWSLDNQSKRIKMVRIFRKILLTTQIVSAVRYGDTGSIEIDSVNYDSSSVDLIVNIALSLFDSLQEYTKQMEDDEDKLKVKFKPKLVIEEIKPFEISYNNDIPVPELREIDYNYDDNEITDNHNDDKLLNHQNDPKTEIKEPDRNIAIKLALNDNFDDGYILDIVNANIEEQETLVNTVDGKENEFKLHKEFPNIYTQSDSIFNNHNMNGSKVEDINTPEVYNSAVPIKNNSTILQDRESDFLQQKYNSTILQDKGSDFLPSPKDVVIVSEKAHEIVADFDYLHEEKDIEKTEDKIQENKIVPDLKWPRKKRKRPMDYRENWHLLNRKKPNKKNKKELKRPVSMKNKRRKRKKGFKDPKKVFPTLIVPPVSKYRRPMKFGRNS